MCVCTSVCVNSHSRRGRYVCICEYDCYCVRTVVVGCPDRFGAKGTMVVSFVSVSLRRHVSRLSDTGTGPQTTHHPRRPSRDRHKLLSPLCSRVDPVLRGPSPDPHTPSSTSDLRRVVLGNPASPTTDTGPVRVPSDRGLVGLVGSGLKIFILGS